MRVGAHLRARACVDPALGAESLLEKNVQKGKMTAQERTEVLQRIQTTTSLDELAGADYIVEVRAGAAVGRLGDEVEGRLCGLMVRRDPTPRAVRRDGGARP